MIHSIVHIAVRFPKVAGAIGLLGAILFGFMALSSYQEMQKIGDTPQTANLESITAYLSTQDRYWVKVTDGELDCPSLHQEPVGSSVNTEVFVKDSTGSILMLVTFTQKLDCSQITSGMLQGVAYPMSAQHESILRSQSRLNDYPDVSRFIELCTTCSPGTSAALIWISIVLMLAGLSIYPLAVRGGKRKEIPATADDVFGA